MQRRGRHSPPGLASPSIQPVPDVLAYYGFARSELSYSVQTFACSLSCWILDSSWMLHFTFLSGMISNWLSILLWYLYRPMPNPLLPLMTSLYTHPLLSLAYPLVQNSCFRDWHETGPTDLSSFSYWHPKNMG